MNTRSPLQTRTTQNSLLQTSLLQRKCAQCDEKDKLLQRQAVNQAEVEEVPAIVHEVLRSSGQPLDTATRTFMESRFGHEFSQVRVHTDATAAESAQAVNALAYTVGTNVVFGASQFAPETDAGKHLLAHELAHVLQQRNAVQQRSEKRQIDIDPLETAERQADRVAYEALYGQTTSSNSVIPSIGLQRKQVGTKVEHKPGAKSTFKKITAEFDGRDFVLFGDGSEIHRLAAQSGRSYDVSAKDAKDCGGSTNDSYMNNPRYVGITDNGPIPEGVYEFKVTQMATFDESERIEILTGASFTDPFGSAMHGGDWGSGRVALKPRKIEPAKIKGCGNTSKRSGFYLHGGVMPGSSGCIDVGNAGYDKVIELLQGYRGNIIVKVQYKHLAPDVDPITRALGRMTYPSSGNESVTGRILEFFGVGSER